MLWIGCPSSKIIEEKFNGLEYKGVHFEYVKTDGLFVTIKCDVDDETGKKLAKEIMRDMPELQGKFTSVKLVDENGTLL